MTICKPPLKEAILASTTWHRALSGVKHRSAFVTKVAPGLQAERNCDVVFPGLWRRLVRVTATLHATNA